jgi:predicted pyridoxine 5'-phosphate oxidase superfamily flavin-nucleotide-binding protein
VADTYHAGFGRVHRTPDQRVPRDGQQRRPALYPASWWAPGFLKVLDDRTIGFADFTGNRQFITLGNLSDNPKAHLFLIDYAHQRRVKIWGKARVVEDDPDLIARLMPQGYGARPERAIFFIVSAWDANCLQHIPQRFEAADVAAMLAACDKRIKVLAAEVELLRSRSPGIHDGSFG